MSLESCRCPYCDVKVPQVWWDEHMESCDMREEEDTLPIPGNFSASQVVNS
jgi:hypothetical protein